MDGYWLAAALLIVLPLDDAGPVENESMQIFVSTISSAMGFESEECPCMSIDQCRCLYHELVACPPYGDKHRMPEAEYIWQMTAFYKEMQDCLYCKMLQHPEKTWYYMRSIDQARFCWEFWATMSEVVAQTDDGNDYRGEVAIRFLLKDLKDMIGDEDYYASRWPRMGAVR